MKDIIKTNSKSMQNKLREILKITEELSRDDEFVRSINSAKDEIIKSLENKGKLMTCGNGGSATQASHMVGEFVGRFAFDRPALPAISLFDLATTTAVGNDYGYDDIFSRFVDSLGNENDILFSISTSGNSGNCLKAMEAAKKNGVRKVVFISSTAVYGVPRFHPIEETTPLVPLGPYGESKFAAEQVCEKYRAQGVDITIIRPKTFLGAERLGLFQILFEWIRNGYGIYTIGNGKNRYQLLAVTDLVEAIWLAATKPNVNETFNVGAEEFVSSKDELNAVGEHAGTGSRVVTTPAWLVKAVLQVLEWLRLSPLSAWHYKTADKDSFVSIEKAKRVLGWQPQKSNTQTLIEGYDWYAANWQKYVNRMGTNHRVSWDQKFLKYFARKMK